MTRRPTTIEVNLIDVTGLEEQALTAVPQDRFPGATHIRAGWTPLGFVRTERGVYALNNEGVGPCDPISDDNPFVVDLYAERREGKRVNCWAYPAVEAKLTVQDLESLATGERLNLADFVRAFGARLDSNYERWRRVCEEGRERNA
jgi:hypothetical protein